LHTVVTVFGGPTDKSGNKNANKAAPAAATSNTTAQASASKPIEKKEQAPVLPIAGKTEWATLRKEIIGDYAAAPGGLKKAIELAQTHLKDRGHDRHFGVWREEALDEKIYVSVPKIWPPPELAREKLNTPSGHSDFVTYGAAMHLRRGAWIIVLNAKAPDFSATKKHELTHATIGKQSTLDLIRPAKQVSLWRYRGYTLFGIGADYWNYAGTYVELDPRIASVKREYVRNTGRQVDTLKEAERAIQWVLEKRKTTGRSNRHVQDVDIINVQERDLRDAIKQRMLELVEGRKGEAVIRSTV
jgi:hypothetical protein